MRSNANVHTRQTFVAGLASRYGRRLRRFFAFRLRNAADAPDLAQEVFLRLMRIDEHETIRSPEAYLFTVASHVLHQHALRQSKQPASVDIEDAVAELQLIVDSDPGTQVDTQVDTQYRIEALERVLARLPPRQAAALLLHRYAGYSIEEIGQELNVSRGTAKLDLANALLHCRQAPERDLK